MEAMAVPIRPGKLEAWQSWCAELAGTRKTGFDEMNRRFGLTTHSAWHQANPDGSDLAIVVIDGPGAREFLGQLARSDHEFDMWFRSSIEEVHPVDFSAAPPPMPDRVL